MESKYSVVSGDSVSVLITNSHSEKSIPLEKKFGKSLTIRHLKEKFSVLTGAGVDTMVIKVYDSDNALVTILDNDDSMLGSYHVDNGMRLHVEDTFALKRSYEEDPNVEKYNMSPEEYEKRDENTTDNEQTLDTTSSHCLTSVGRGRGRSIDYMEKLQKVEVKQPRRPKSSDTLKAYLEKNKLGKYNPEEQAKREAEKKQEDEAEEEAVKSITIGNRCEVNVPGQPTRRAEVKFVGKTDFKPGWWVGVKYDEPMGKNDGSINGVRYFECAPKYGGFIKPLHIKIGDFPEEDDGLDEI